jgi:hypothetical protein
MKEKDFLAMPEKERKSRTLEGIAYWASVHKPNMSAVTKFKGVPAYMISLGLDEANIKLAKEYGLTVKDADEYIPMPYVKLQRKITPPKTEKDVKLEVVDSMQNNIPASILIGNGSLVRCKFGTRWANGANAGVKADLYKVQVRKLVEYVSNGDRDLVKDETGFIIPNVSAEDSEIDFED